VRELCETFGERLIAVVVYGSHARGTALPRSDVDLLVVVRGLPREGESIHRLEDEWAHKGRRLGKRIQVMLASPEDGGTTDYEPRITNHGLHGLHRLYRFDGLSLWVTNSSIRI